MGFSALNPSYALFDEGDIVGAVDRDSHSSDIAAAIVVGAL
jgi:hypothetical protein